MIAEINIALTGLRSAIDIARALRAADNAAAIAGARLQISDLVDKLVDAKEQFTEISNLVDARDKEIADLKRRLQRSGEVVKHLGAYYDKGVQDRPAGDPYCSRCFEVEGLLVHITLPAHQNAGTTCPQCRQQFPWSRTPPIRE